MFSVTVTYNDGSTHEFDVDVNDFGGDIIDDTLATDPRTAEIIGIDVMDGDTLVDDFFRVNMTSREYTKRS
jgi:hypothetical protein